jgi:hypothetical protein
MVLGEPSTNPFADVVSKGLPSLSGRRQLAFQVRPLVEESMAEEPFQPEAGRAFLR